MTKEQMCIVDLWKFIEYIEDMARNRDLSPFRIPGYSVCDMYQGLPVICRDIDNLLNKNEETIHLAFRAYESENG